MRGLCLFVTSWAIVLVCAFPAQAQARKTSWGDPDIAGTLDEVTPAELAKLLDRRHQQTERTATIRTHGCGRGRLACSSRETKGSPYTSTPATKATKASREF